MGDGLSIEVRRHLARVYAILAACILASAGSCALLVALVPWVPPYTYVVAITSAVGLIVGVIAFACMPRERFVTRYFLLMAMCMCGGTFFAYFVQAALEEDVTILTRTLIMTSTIFVCFSAAAILTPQKKVVMYMVALGLVIVSLIVFSVVLATFNVFVYSSALQAVYTFATLAVFSLYIVWETEVIILKASEGDCDPVGDAAKLFSDLIDVFLRVASCLAGSKKSNAEQKPLLTEGSVA